jgi:predicted nucleic acid-binding protein
VVLVDTSVWVSHLRDGHEGLRALLDEGLVMCHPFVIGELACGNLTNRAEIISLLRALPPASVAAPEEVLAFVEARDLAGKGLGYVDVHLLAAAVVTGVPLWTEDKRLNKAALEIHCSHREGPVAWSRVEDEGR